MSGNWKTNVGQSILEEISVSDKHKAWIDAVSQMFGGLDICSLEAVVSRIDGKEWIIEVNGSKDQNGDIRGSTGKYDL